MRHLGESEKKMKKKKNKIPQHGIISICFPQEETLNPHWNPSSTPFRHVTQKSLSFSGKGRNNSKPPSFPGSQQHWQWADYWRFPKKQVAMRVIPSGQRVQ